MDTRKINRLRCVKQPDGGRFTVGTYYEVHRAADPAVSYAVVVDDHESPFVDVFAEGWEEYFHPVTESPKELGLKFDKGKPASKSHRDRNVGESDYATKEIQPWDIWLAYQLDGFLGDIVKRVLRNKKGESKRKDYEKIKHIADELIYQIDIGVRSDETGKLI
jgi:hypothetical protein